MILPCICNDFVMFLHHCAPFPHSSLVADMTELGSQFLARKSAQDGAIEDGSGSMTWTAEKSEVQKQSDDWSDDHPVNLRLSIPLLSTRYHATLIMGREQRSPQRRAAERQKHPLQTKGNVACLFVAGTIVGIGLFTIVQLVGNWVLAQTGWIKL